MTSETARGVPTLAVGVPLRVVSLGACFLLGAARADAATEAPRCSAIPPGVEVVAALPGPIRGAVERELGDVALPDEPFNPTDVVEPGRKTRRILFVWHRDERWVVATERGGRGYSSPVLALNLGAGKAEATVAANRTALPDTLCETAAALLD